MNTMNTLNQNQSNQVTIQDRDFFNAYRDSYVPAFVKNLISEAESASAFEIGIESDKRRRGVAINTDVYGWDHSQGLVVIQVRRCEFHPRRFNHVRKNYLLIGRNERTGLVFTHGVPSPLRSKYAMQDPESCVKWILSKIWDCKISDLDKILRQGDIAFIPIKKIPNSAQAIEQNEIILRGSHRLKADAIYKDEQHIYVSKARLIHAKGQHACVRTKKSH